MIYLPFRSFSPLAFRTWQLLSVSMSFCNPSLPILTLTGDVPWNRKTECLAPPTQFGAPHTAEPHDTALETQVRSLIEFENAFNGLKKLHFSLWIECIFRYINIFTQKNCFPPSFMQQLFIEFLLCQEYKAVKKKKSNMVAAILDANSVLSTFGFWFMPCPSLLPLEFPPPRLLLNNHPLLACMISKLEQLS